MQIIRIVVHNLLPCFLGILLCLALSTSRVIHFLQFCANETAMKLWIRLVCSTECFSYRTFAGERRHCVSGGFARETPCVSRFCWSYI